MRLRVGTSTLFALARGFLACGLFLNSASADTVFRGATLIDGTGASPIPDAIVVVEGSLITAVGSANDVEIPPNAELIDVTGKWLIPGMSDAHVHLNKSGGLYSSPESLDLRPW